MKLTDVLSFLRENDNKLFSDTSDEKMLKLITDHLMYNTLTILKDEKGISAFARWNIVSNELAEVLDVVIRKDRYFSKLLIKLCKISSKRYPHIKFLRFGRILKYDRPRRVISLEKILNRNK